MEPSGRLELTWSNKHMSLLSGEDGSYEWVHPSDYRVSEVRLLHALQTIGETEGNRAQGNLLIRGDALHALRSLNELPEFAKEYVGRVRLAYIDPPFNTGQAFTDYDDNLEHSVWLTMLRDRLEQIKPLLASNGSVWVHLDDVEVHRARSVMDEVFGASCFVAQVVWQKSYSRKNDAAKFSTAHNLILVYSAEPGWKSRGVPRTMEADSRYSSPDDDPRLWKSGDAFGPSAESHQGMVYAVQSPFTGELKYPPIGNCWRSDQSEIQRHFEQWGSRYELTDLNDADRRALICGVNPSEVRPGVKALMLAGDLATAQSAARERYDAGVWPSLYFTKNGLGGVSRKVYLDSVADRMSPTTVWPYQEVGHSQTAVREQQALFPGMNTFDTPKPEAHIPKNNDVATDVDDIVLDCFAGSGTTAAVAHKSGRRWVTVERSADTMSAFTLPRLAAVVDGSDRGGVSTQQVLASDDRPSAVKIGSAKEAADVLGEFAKHGALDGLHTDMPKALLKRLAQVGPDLLIEVEEAVLKVLRSRLLAADATETDELWTGGGGFRLLEVGRSMFDEVGGRVFLADWATNGALAEAVAAQFGFEYVPEQPFTGRKGKQRLAVVDGLVNEGVVRALLDVLPSDERLCVCGTAIDGSARDTLKELRAGSTMRKVPQSLLAEYKASRERELAQQSLDRIPAPVQEIAP